MKQTNLNNMYEVENIIRKTLSEMFPRGFKMPLYANDTKYGTGHTFKFHRSSEFKRIWPVVLQKLHSLGMNNWTMSNSMNYSDPEKPVPASWTGIRSARLNRKKA